MPSAPTRSSTPRLSDVARHVVAPAGVVTTGWPAVRDKCVDLGIRFRWWQEAIGKLILSKRADGKYAATIGGTGLSIPRQVGKTFLVGAIVFALCLLRPKLTVIWTAHRVRTSEETFKKMQAFAAKSKIRPHIAQIFKGSGEEEIRFLNGSRILFGARESGFGRGFDEVDVLIYDEGQILTDAALDAQIPALNQCRQDTGALLLFMGTPPKPTDPGEVFTRMRTEALSGEDEDTGWVELGAEPGYSPTPLPARLTPEDWRQVAIANPSYPDDTPPESILRMRKKLGHDSFIREGFGIWTDKQAESIIDLRIWGALAQDVGEQPEQVSYSLEVPNGRESAVIGCAWTHDTVPHVEIAKVADGTSWVIDWLKKPRTDSDAAATSVVVDVDSEAGSLIPDLERAGIQVVPVRSKERAQACAGLFDLAIAGDLTHNGDPDLTESLAAASWKVSEGGARCFSRKAGGAPIARIYAATFALWGEVNTEHREFWGAIA